MLFRSGPIGGTVVMGEEDETAKKKVCIGVLLSYLVEGGKGRITNFSLCV